MSATWICMCGHNFTDYGAVSGEVICCPKCGAILGEALPTHFESPTTFQSELPSERVLLASPEVAVQATEPPARSSRRAPSDELREPDIRINRARVWVWRLCLVFGVSIVALVIIGAFHTGQLGDESPLTAAQIQVKALTIVCDAYKAKHAKHPDSLATLLDRDEFGTVWLDDHTKLIDPWMRPYQYDAKGPNNKGLHPDIWVVSPNGRTIGNWQKMRER
jgi:general secretion pathway protein G